MASAPPCYHHLHQTGELRRRAEQAAAGLAACHWCPRACGADRLAGEDGFCRTGPTARVASCHPHHGEEACLSGWRGSGTIFFSGCNLACVFCQNYELSHGRSGTDVDGAGLADLMLQLQARGCHNINLVTPDHVVATLLDALAQACDAGLSLPIVYNTSGYCSLETLQLLDGIVDIYMPDFKCADPRQARRHLLAPDYPEVVRQAVREMHRQVGDLTLDDRGLARQGLLVRHLVMPGGVEDTRQIMRFLATEVSPRTYVNIMGQFHPAGQVGGGRFAELDRRLSPSELSAAVRAALEQGLTRLDGREPVERRLGG